MMRMPQDEFEATVAEALDGLPLAFAELIENVVIQVREAPDLEMLHRLELDPQRHTLLGLYVGVPLERRGMAYGNVLPDMVLLFRQPLLAATSSRAGLVRQIQLTLLHELGHHFGLTDAQMKAWEREFAGLG